MKRMMKKAIVVSTAVVTLATSTVGASAAGLRDVFDARYYADTYADLKEAYGYDEEALYQHYLTYGVKEGRTMSPVFDVVKYREEYGDLDSAFGDNWDAYVEHYFSQGFKEGRVSGGIFDPIVYAEAYPDIKEAFGDNVEAIVEHYLKHGIEEGRTAGVTLTVEDKSGETTQVTAPVENVQSSAEDNSNASSGNNQTPDKPAVPKAEFASIYGNPSVEDYFSKFIYTGTQGTKEAELYKSSTWSDFCVIYDTNGQSHSGDISYRSKDYADQDVPGEYMMDITVECNDSTFTFKKTVQCKLTIYAFVANVQSIIKEQPITVANGTQLNSIPMYPEIGIITDDGKRDTAHIDWDLSTADYDPKNKEEQHFTIKGSIVLYYGYTNTNNIKLETEREITVLAANPNASAPEYDSIGYINNGTEWVTSSFIYTHVVTVGKEAEYYNEENVLDNYYIKDTNGRLYHCSLSKKAGDNFDPNTPGTYDLFITVKCDEDVDFEYPTSFKESIEVCGVIATVKSIAQPEPISVEHGTRISDIGLPGTVRVTMENGNIINSSVSWNKMDIHGYNPTKEEEQTFTIAGKIDYLGVGYISNIPLDVEIKVTVKAAATSEAAGEKLAAEEQTTAGEVFAVETEAAEGEDADEAPEIVTEAAAEDIAEDAE